MKKKREKPFLDVYSNDVFVGRIEDKTETIAHLVASASPGDTYKVINRYDELVVSTIGCFLDTVPDQTWLQKTLLPQLLPLQTGEKTGEPVVYL